VDSFRALTKRFQYHQKFVNGFWKHWHADYLKSLTPLKIWYKIGREIYKGDLVLVSEDHGHPHRLRWSCPVCYPADPIYRLLQRLHLFETCDADLSAELN